MAKRLTRYILIALVLGVIAGWAINAAIDDGTPASAVQLKSIADYLSIVTALFLRLIKMIIAPLVFSTLVAGIAHMGDIAALGRVGVRSLGWFILASLVSLTLGLILVTLLHPGVGLNLPIPPATAASGVETAAFNLKDFVSHLVPASIFEAMSTNEILPIVIFSIFFGVALTAVGDKGKPIVRGIESLVRVMLQVTDYVMRFAPFAVFTAVASALAERGPQIIMTLGKFVGSFYLGLAHPVDGPDRRRVRHRRPAHAPSRPLHPRSGRARLLDRVERGRLSTHARSARPLRRAAAHRELRPAVGLFVQPRRLDDVHDLRDDLHRPGLWHPPQHRPGSHHAAGADDHFQGHGRRPASKPGGDRRNHGDVQDPGSRAAADPRRRPLPRHGPLGNQCRRQCRGSERGRALGRRSRTRAATGLRAAPRPGARRADRRRSTITSSRTGGRCSAAVG